MHYRLKKFPKSSSKAGKTSQQLPAPVYTGHIAGMRFHLHPSEEVDKLLKPGQLLRLQPEPTNPFDARAIMVLLGQRMLGYVKRDENQVLQGMLLAGLPLVAWVDQVRPAEDWYLRVRYHVGVQGHGSYQPVQHGPTWGRPA